MTDNTRPIVCTLQPGELRQRKSELLPELVRQATKLIPIDGGYRVEFSSDMSIGDISRVIESERTCCQFLRFQLVIEPGLGAVRLDLTGPPGTAAFLASLFEA